MKLIRMLTLLVVMISCVENALALPPEVREALRPTTVVTISERNLSDIWRLRPGSERQLTPHYIIIDAPWNKLSSEMRNTLLSYIESGHGALLTEHNVSAALIPSDIRAVGRHSFDSDITAYAVSSPHPILTAVRFVDIPRYDRDGDNRSPWINRTLRQMDRDRGTPILSGPKSGDHDTFACIAYQVGAGRVALFAQRLDRLPIVQNSGRLGTRDNRRFAHNLDQWLAGFPVPGAAAVVGSGAPVGAGTPPARDTIILKNGDVITGRVESPEIEIRTSYASLRFAVPTVAHVVIEGGGRNVDSLQLHTGDRLSGMIETPKIAITLTTGSTVELERDRIKEIRIVPRPE